MRGTFKALMLGVAMASLMTSANAETRLTIMVFQGVENLPFLAAQMKGFFRGGTPPAPAKYLDLSYYQKALAGM